MHQPISRHEYRPAWVASSEDFSIHTQSHMEEDKSLAELNRHVFEEVPGISREFSTSTNAIQMTHFHE